MLIYLDKVRTNQAAFGTKVTDICNRLGIDPNWLMATMYIESEMDHKAVNSSSGATGLIQFLSSTAVDLGTTTTALKAMDNLTQLDWVYKYMKQYNRKIKSFTDCYFAVFFPSAIGKYSEWVLQSYGLSPGFVANKNGGYDLNKDNEITFREVESKILLMVAPQYRGMLKATNVPTVVNWDAERVIRLLLSVTLLVAGGWLMYKIFKK